jgi:hypothetical protein
VFGPAGRCGSHWVETLLKNLLGVWYTIDSFTPLATGWIYHTNSTIELEAMPSKIRDSVILVYCVRKNHFDVAISFLVAENTDEWFAYTNKTIEPFVVDPVKFRALINDLHYKQTIEVPQDILPLFNNLVIIDFDHLISSAIPEKYVADKLGIDYDVDKNHYQSDSILNTKNPRNYKDLILNWDELVDIYQNHLVDQ